MEEIVAAVEDADVDAVAVAVDDADADADADMGAVADADRAVADATVDATVGRFDMLVAPKVIWVPQKQ